MMTNRPDDDKELRVISVVTPDGVLRGPAAAISEYMAERWERVRERRRRRWPLRPDGEVDTRRAMSVLARSFPTLRQADGVEPWDVDRFVAWLCGPAPSHGAMHAGRFVLGVWHATADWRQVARELRLDSAEALSRFDFVEAVRTWDDEHRAACARWMELPFWP
jgi:hypothetical protein